MAVRVRSHLRPTAKTPTPPGRTSTDELPSGTGNAVTVRGSYNDDASAWLRFEHLKITTTASPGNRPVGIFVLESYRPYIPHHITFSNCTIEGFKHGITVVSQSGTQTDPSLNITIRNNILHSNRPASPVGGDYGGYLSITDPIDGVFIYNKAFYGISDDNERILYVYSASPSNLQIKNNILARTDLTRAALEISNVSALAGMDLDNNLYHYSGGVIIRVAGVNYSDLPGFRAEYPTQEAEGVQGDPAFADPPADFHLTAASVNAIDLGADATGLVDSDFDGAQRPWDGDQSGTAQWDIGPYEYLSPIPIFEDGFESGGTTSWSLAAGQPPNECHGRLLQNPRMGFGRTR